MTIPTSARRTPLLAIGALVAVAAIAGIIGLWYVFFRPAGPPPVSLASLPAATQRAGTDASSSPQASGGTAVPGDPAASAGDAGTGASPGSGGSDGLDGTWTVATTIGSLDDGSGTFVGYRVQEQLATVGAAEAVGRTPDVTGTLAIDGTTITAVDVTADVTTLRSDESNRDRQLSRQALETARFPTASFTLTQPIELGTLPAQGEIVEAAATGDLTLHGVTRSVSVPLQARLDGDVITVAGSLPITFADWSIQQPRSMIVLSVDDHATLELQLHFTRA